MISSGTKQVELLDFTAVEGLSPVSMEDRAKTLKLLYKREVVSRESELRLLAKGMIAEKNYKEKHNWSKWCRDIGLVVSKRETSHKKLERTWIGVKLDTRGSPVQVVQWCIRMPFSLILSSPSEKQFFQRYPDGYACGCYHELCMLFIKGENKY